MTSRLAKAGEPGLLIIGMARHEPGVVARRFHRQPRSRSLDLDLVHRILAASYWASGVPRAVVARSIRTSIAFGLYRVQAQISSGRLIRDRTAPGGDLDRVKRCVKLGVFVNSAKDFTDQPKVANGASDLMVEIFGEAGRHARFAVGANVLPLNVAVEVDAVFEVA